MNRKMIIIAIAVIALACIACSITINLPNSQVKTGPTETETIEVPYLSDRQAIADQPFHDINLPLSRDTDQSGARSAHAARVARSSPNRSPRP